MNIQKIKAALAKQAQLMGVVPVAKTDSAQAVTIKSDAQASTALADNTAVIVKKEKSQATTSTIVAAPAKTAPVSISSDKAMPVNTSLFDTIASPTGTPKYFKDSCGTPSYCYDYVCGSNANITCKCFSCQSAYS